MNSVLDDVFVAAEPPRRHQGRFKNERSSLARASDTPTAKTSGRQIAVDLRRTIFHFFPDLFSRLEAVTDPRLRRDYTVTEILLGGLFMFICKEDSRNAMNDDRGKAVFAANFETLFGKRLPHMDTVDDVLVRLSNDELERLKAALVATLIEKKVFGKLRLLNKYYRVAVDGTGVLTVNEGHCPHCLKRESKNGVVTYFHNILEAKLITPNGFALSLGTEWIENQATYDKQDCELKAFARLADKLKVFFPKLPICIHADGLYPNKTFFGICAAKDWRFVATFKDGCLPSLVADIESRLPHPLNRRTTSPFPGIEQTYRWIDNLAYQSTNMAWIECLETKVGQTTCFAYVTDLPVTGDNVESLVQSGRLRFKIENEGFNAQKNLGYNLEHQFSRTSYNAAKNYVSLMQIAHLLNQLYQLSPLFTALAVGKKTVKALWKQLISFITESALDITELAFAARFQIRYE